MKVVVCPGFVLEDRGATPGDPKVVPLPDTDAPRIRSNDFAAISAYQNVKRFFQRLEAYGLGGRRYFQVAKLPLKLFYRSGIQPGPGKDGQTVNARVRVEGWKADFEGPTKAGEHPKFKCTSLWAICRRERESHGMARTARQPNLSASQLIRAGFGMSSGTCC